MGETITEEIIPIGEKEPKRKRLEGIVKICAEKLADKEEESFSGNIFIVLEFIKSESRRIPKSAL